MSKLLKVVGIVVGVIAAVATAGAGIPGLAAALGTTAGTLSTIASVAALAAVGTSLLQMAIGPPKPGFSQTGNPLAFQTNPQSGLPYAFGRTRMSGVRIHGDTYDSPTFASEGRDDVLSFAVMLSAGGAVDAIEEFRAEKAAVTFNPDGSANGTHSGWMAQKMSLGLAGASALALTFGGVGFPGWTSAHKLSGITHALWDLRFDSKGEHYSAGVPQPEWIGRWTKAYDPRLDSTYPGGSGSHRALDESTYAWTDNPALVALTWALGRWQNGKRTLGIGAPIENIRVADFVEAANVAEANDWTCGGVAWTTDSKWQTFKSMLQAGGAEPTMTGAMIGCRVNTPRVSIATITGADLLDGLTIAATKPRRERINSCIPRYRSEDHDWEIISGSPITVGSYVDLDGDLRSREVDFPFVQHEVAHDGNAQAGQLAAYEVVNAREAGPWTFAVGPAFVGLKTGDCITIDVPDEGIAAQPVIVRRRSIDPATLKISFTVETETTAKHDFALGRTTTPPPTYEPTPPDLTPPTPSAALWSLAVAGPSGNALPGIVVAGTCEFPGADHVLVEYRKVGAANWSTVGKQDATAPVRVLITGLEGGVSFEARVAYQSGQRIGPWRTLASVTTPSFSVIDVNEVVANFDSRNDRDGSAIPACTILTDGTAVDHVLPGNGNADISFEWNFPGVETGIDRFEVMVVTRTSATAYSPGNTPSIETIYDVPRHCRAFIALGVSPTNYTTFAVRAVRVVDPDINASRRVVSNWAKPTASGENPYRPDTQIAFAGNVSGTVNGVFATTVSAAVINFNARNDRDGSAVAAPIVATDGTAVDHTKRSGGVLVDISFQFSYSAPIAGVDWHEVMVRASTSAFAYTPGTTPTQETIIRIPATKWGVILQGFPPNLYYTFAVRTIRTVDPDINADREIRSAWVKATGTGENPYRPEVQTAYEGLIGDTLSGVPATLVAATVDPVTGNIADAKVVTDSIDDDAINVSDWREQGTTLVFTPSDEVELTWSGGTAGIGGDRVVLGYSFTWEISVTNPTQGTEYWFDVTPHRASSGGAIVEEYTGWRESMVWTGPTTTGTFTFGKRLTTKLRPVEAPPAGNWNFGLTIETPSQNGLVVHPNWAINIDDKRAGQ